jgi:hypothetical protein
MKLRKKNVLREMAGHLRLKISFVSYFDGETYGKLLPREGRILINANMPRQEHVFTMLHEIGHFLLHFKNPHRKHHPRVLDVAGKIEWLAKFCKSIRRQLRFHFSKPVGKEWEADLWALCAFTYLARHYGFREELTTFLNRHPEKIWSYRLVKLAMVYTDCKKRVSAPFRLLAKANS